MSPQCQHCGESVSRRYARVLGDENNIVHRCPSCDSKHRRFAGSSAGLDIDWPDPQDQPNRNRGQCVEDVPKAVSTDGGEDIDRGKGPIPDGGEQQSAALLKIPSRMLKEIQAGNSRVCFSKRKIDVHQRVLLADEQGVPVLRVELIGRTGTTAQEINKRILDELVSGLLKNNSYDHQDPLPTMDTPRDLQQLTQGTIEGFEDSFKCYILGDIQPAEPTDLVADGGFNRGDSSVE